jgi:ribosome-binding protein aMBF1 (putative translation factor)
MRATMMLADKWISLDTLENEPAIKNGGSEAGVFFVRRSRDPARAARLASARKKLGEALDATYGQRTGLVALRLKAGLSQTEIAKRMGTQQPSVARWERAPGTLGFETIEAFARALGVKVMDVCAAICAQRQTTSTEVVHEGA